MRSVIYNREFEPVTVIELPPSALAILRQRGQVRVAVIEPISLEQLRAPPSATFGIPHVDLHRGNEQCTALVCDDEVGALRLKPALLAGQRALVKEAEERARGLGLAAGMSIMRRPFDGL